MTSKTMIMSPQDQQGCSEGKCSNPVYCVNPNGVGMVTMIALASPRFSGNQICQARYLERIGRQIYTIITGLTSLPLSRLPCTMISIRGTFGREVCLKKTPALALERS